MLPGRNPAVVAKQLASLDRLSDGRLLVAFGLGLPDPRERAAFPIPAGQTRGQAFDAALVLVRRYLGGEAVNGVRVQPDPLQQPLDLWIGGSSPAALGAGRAAGRRMAPEPDHPRRGGRGSGGHRPGGRGNRPAGRSRALGVTLT